MGLLPISVKIRAVIFDEIKVIIINKSKSRGSHAETKCEGAGLK